MRTERTAEQVVSVGNVRNPIAQRFINRVFQSARAGIYLADSRAEQLHAKDIQGLPPHILRPHVNDTFETEQRTYRCGRDAMLARTGFGDDPTLAHASRQENLSERVVYFMRAGMKQVFALEINARATGMIGQPLGKEKRGWPPRVIMQQRIEFLVKILISPRYFVSRSQLFQRRHQRLGNKATTITTPVAERVRLCDWFHRSGFKL